MAESSYDEIPYPLLSFSESHPRQMQAVAHVIGGLATASPGECRVLELGCAVGGNIVPMAYASPSSRFIGIDLSAPQIEKARAFAQAVGVTSNLDLRAASITDVTPEWGTFDYIICHGVYSWVPPDVQEKTLQICGEQLSERGVAYISFNVLPGWHSRTPIRDAMLFHTENIKDPLERARAGRAFVLALAESPSTPPHVIATLQAEMKYLQGKSESYILHEYLEPLNEPLYFRDFASRAARHGLQYVGDASINVSLDENWPPAQQWRAAAGDDVVRAEQYADFVSGRTFRRALLCKAGAKLDRAGAAERLENMFAEGQLKQWAHGAGATRFERPNGKRFVTQSPALRNVLSTISTRFPRAVRIGELIDPSNAADVTQGLLQCWQTGLIRLYAEPPAYVMDAAAVAPAPRATAVARYLAAAGESPINLRHETVTLSPQQRSLTALLDGTRSRDELSRMSEIPGALLDQTIAQLVPAALIER